MATATEAHLPQAQAVDIPYDLTIDLFSRIVEGGLIPRNRRVFLQDGRLFEKMAKTKAHGYVGAAITRTLNRSLPDDWCLWPESTVVLDSNNAPLPDFSVIRGSNPLDFGSPERYPVPSDIGILIEVAVTSLRDDLTSALERYARALIPVYWVVDVPGRRILVHSEPKIVEGRGAYTRVEVFRTGEYLPLVLDGHEAARIFFDTLLR